MTVYYPFDLEVCDLWIFAEDFFGSHFVCRIERYVNKILMVPKSYHCLPLSVLDLKEKGRNLF